MGIMIFLGLNSALATQLSQAYGCKDLVLCGHYMNRAHIKNILLFLPMLAMLCLMGSFFTMVG